VGAVVLTILVPFFWQDLGPFQWLLMVTMGTAGAMGHFLLVKAFHSAEASMLAPFTYSGNRRNFLGLYCFWRCPKRVVGQWGRIDYR